MLRAKCILLLSLLGTLAACGGGEDDSPAQTATSQTAAPAPAPATETAPETAGAVAQAQSCGLPDFRSEMLARVNAARAERRLCGTQSFSAAPPLAWDEQLFAAAAGHAEDMARNDYFEHDSPDGRTFSQRISDAGYAWSAAGENIAAGQADVEQVVGAWLDSPGHCANIMSDSFSEIGVACVSDEASTYTQYWAMSLGRPR